MDFMLLDIFVIMNSCYYEYLLVLRLKASLIFDEPQTFPSTISYLLSC